MGVDCLIGEQQISPVFYRVLNQNKLRAFQI